MRNRSKLLGILYTWQVWREYWIYQENGKSRFYQTFMRHPTCTHNHLKWIYKMKAKNVICKKTQAQNMPLAYFAFVGFEFVLKYKVSDVLLLGRDIRMKTDYCIELYTTLPPTLQEMNAYWIYVLQIRFHYSLIALRRYTMASQNSLWGFHLCTINSLLHAHFQRKRSTYVHNLIWM